MTRAAASDARVLDGTREVGGGDDADQAACLDHEDPMDAVLDRELRGLADRRVGADDDRSLGHDRGAGGVVRVGMASLVVEQIPARDHAHDRSAGVDDRHRRDPSHGEEVAASASGVSMPTTSTGAVM